MKNNFYILKIELILNLLLVNHDIFIVTELIHQYPNIKWNQ
jgi:hypothetical protein